MVSRVGFNVINNLVDCFKSVSSDPHLYLGIAFGKLRPVNRAERGNLKACFDQAINELKQQKDSPQFQQKLALLRESTLLLQARFENAANSLQWKIGEIYYAIIGFISCTPNPVSECIKSHRKEFREFMAFLDEIKYQPAKCALVEARKEFQVVPFNAARIAYAEPRDITLAKDNFRWRDCKGESIRVRKLADLQEIIKMLTKPHFHILVERFIIDINEGQLSQQEFQLLLRAIKEQKSTLYVFENLNVENGLTKETIFTLCDCCQARWMPPVALDLQSAILSLAFAFPNAVKLRLANVSNVTVDDLKALLAALPLVEEVDLTGTLPSAQIDALLGTFVRSCLKPKALLGGTVGAKEIEKAVNHSALFLPQIGPDTRLAPRQLEEAFTLRPHLIAADFLHIRPGSMALDSFLATHPYLELVKLAPEWTLSENLDLTQAKPDLVRELIPQLPKLTHLILGKGITGRDIQKWLEEGHLKALTHLNLEQIEQFERRLFLPLAHLKVLLLPKNLERVWQNFLLISRNQMISEFTKEALCTSLLYGAQEVNLEQRISVAGLEEISDDYIVRLGEVLEALYTTVGLLPDPAIDHLIAMIETKLLPLKANAMMQGRGEVQGLLQKYPQAFPSILFLIDHEIQRQESERANQEAAQNLASLELARALEQQFAEEF